MVLELAKSEHPLLTQKLEEFDFKNPPVDPVELANTLIETLKAKRGMGLSANQVGLPHRVFVLWSEKPFVCFNPRIVDVSTETNLLEEGCLSFPHLLIKIKRPAIIKVRFENAFGETQTEKFVGMTARAFLHELDHMDGVLFQSRANRIHLDRALHQQKVLTRRLKRGEVTIRPGIMTESQLKDAQLSIRTSDKMMSIASEISV